MHCPKCGCKDSKVVESRDTGEAVRRRRQCLKCRHRYSTYERVEKMNLAVIKRSGSRELFDRDKLKRAIHQSVGKFLHGETETEEIVSSVENALYALGENEIQSRQIGELVLSELLKHNEVAYIRFASVFHEFKTIDEFTEILNKLRK
ncbi:MAG: transcriptional regulator NrdR [Candidatus Nomurabacteria bacterium]|jgi:transcriptional repressor NrdR|nr:transcriptional regulator NrdR [Candidatus Nomurabacteria bacterium]